MDGIPWSRLPYVSPSKPVRRSGHSTHVTTLPQYLAGLSTIMIGYLWFLYHNREVSYRAALNLTVSRRQNALYQARGFDLRKWEARKEIKIIADEYDVEWDEKADEGSEQVHDALKEERDKERKASKDEKDDDDSGNKGKEKSSKKDD